MKNLTKIRQAAEQGSASSQYLLGRMLLDGDGVKQEVEAAMIWLRRAADAAPDWFPARPRHPRHSSFVIENQALIPPAGFS